MLVIVAHFLAVHRVKRIGRRQEDDMKERRCFVEDDPVQRRQILTCKDTLFRITKYIIGKTKYLSNPVSYFNHSMMKQEVGIMVL